MPWILKTPYSRNRTTETGRLNKGYEIWNLYDKHKTVEGAMEKKKGMLWCSFFHKMQTIKIKLMKLKPKYSNKDNLLFPPPIKKLTCLQENSRSRHRNRYNLFCSWLFLDMWILWIEFWLLMWEIMKSIYTLRNKP